MQYKLSDVAVKLNLYPNGPSISSEGSAGIDLFVASETPITIWPTKVTEIETGLYLWMNDSSVAGLLMPRGSSEIRFTNTIGLIDSDYQGQVIIKAISLGEDTVILRPKQKIAQLVLAHVVSPLSVNFQLTEEFDAKTTRGEGRFNSTGSM